MISCASFAGGDAAKDCFRLLERQLQSECIGPANDVPAPEIPLSQADFESAIPPSS